MGKVIHFATLEKHSVVLLAKMFDRNVGCQAMVAMGIPGRGGRVVHGMHLGCHRASCPRGPRLAMVISMGTCLGLASKPLLHGHGGRDLDFVLGVGPYGVGGVAAFPLAQSPVGFGHWPVRRFVGRVTGHHHRGLSHHLHAFTCQARCALHRGGARLV